MKDNHKKYIQRTFYLAKKGIGKVAPNPLVGCVIVKNNKIIGEGYHKEYGDKHAEINAINNVSNKKEIEGSSVYINLEPCNHFGKTPPCSDALVKLKPKEVIISNKDPNPLTNGKSIKKLIDNNINVRSNILKEEGEELNKRFFKNQIKKLPFIILKWAQTSDGFIAKSDGSSKWISNDISRTLVHKWRSEELGILVGAKTVNSDNPKLNVRSWDGKDPIRVIIDPNNRCSNKNDILSDTLPTLIYNKKRESKVQNKQFVRLLEFNLLNILKDILSRGISSIMVEGGSFTLQSFIENNLWDEARVFVSDGKFKNGIKAPKIKLSNPQKIGSDQLYLMKNYA
ncbi:MAG: riboflavin biosynthesis protein RibD [Flammeovirgaceae bacterium]|nr:riboflavin biosynthesis protein RibD [Flammeovirgaceae bacterium]